MAWCWKSSCVAWNSNVAARPGEQSMIKSFQLADGALHAVERLDAEVLLFSNPDAGENFSLMHIARFFSAFLQFA